jgi:molecular chaperone GrpE
MNDKIDEKYLRIAADFDNYRKRMHEEIKHSIAIGNEKLLLEIADVLDATERSKTGDYDMSILLKQILKKHGWVRIETSEQLLDPTTMEAVSMVEGLPEQSQQVQSEVRAGWMINHRVIRPARVIIYK